MTAPTAPASVRDLIDLAHGAARAALRDPGRDPLDAVSWLSAHLAATEQVLLPAARPRPGGKGLADRQLAADHQLLADVWRLDRRLTGDLRQAGQAVDGLVARVLDALAEHERAEHDLVAVLADRDEGLAERLTVTTQRAPTRPHPYSPQRGRLGRFAFRVEGLVDAARDGMDARRTAAPRRLRVPRPGGRWSAYLAGVPDRPRPDGP